MLTTQCDVAVAALQAKCLKAKDACACVCVWRVLGGALGGLETDEGGGGEKQADPPALQRSAKILTRPKKWGAEEEEVEKEEEEEEGKKKNMNCSRGALGEVFPQD